MIYLLRAARNKLRNTSRNVFNCSDTGHNIIIKPLPEAQAKAIAENNYLARHAANIASQGGEDGVIAKILEIIGFTEPGWCVEFGACDGRTDSNTWNLVKNKGWSAVYDEPEPEFFVRLQQHCKETPNTWCFNELVDSQGPSSLTNILKRTPIPKDFELMCVDIDGNDYYVWEALEEYRPHIVCIEFHRLVHPSVDFVQPKDPSLNRPASIKSLTRLAKRKGYELVCVVNWNLFFVRSEHFSRFGIKDNRPEAMYHCSEEMRIFQGYDGTLFLYGNENHYWKYQRNSEGVTTNIRIAHEDIQVLPNGLRVYRPRHTYRSETLEKQAGMLDAARLPGNQLLQYRHNVASECGEDGIIDHLIKKLNITNGYGVEIGAGNGKTHSNLWKQVCHHNWKGIATEAETSGYNALKQTYAKYPGVTCLNKAIGAEPGALDALLSRCGVPASFGLLSLDAGGHDYHLWKGLKSHHPAIVIVDFNPSIGNDTVFIQAPSEYEHHGCSLRALIELAERKGYVLAAVTDWNAIFVQSAMAQTLGITARPIDDMYYPPFEMRMCQTLDGCLHLFGCTTLVRQDYHINWEDFQVLPQSLRGRDNSFEHFGKMVSIFYEQ